MLLETRGNTSNVFFFFKKGEITITFESLFQDTGEELENIASVLSSCDPFLLAF